jgi:hypothetical protein
MPTGAPYVSASELAEYLRMDPPAESAGDDLMTLTVASASSWVQDYTHRDFNLAEAATARYFDTTHAGMLFVDDIGHATISVATDSSQDGTWATSWATTDFQVNPLAAIAEGEPVTSLLAVGSYTYPAVSRRRGLVRVTARWGWPEVPAAVKQATLIQASRLYKRHESPAGVLGGGDFGTVRVGTRVDPDVEMLLAPYRYVLVG